MLLMVIKMDKKEFENELELVQKGADALKASINYTERLEVRVCELETKIHELERRFNKHVNNLDAHKE